MLILGIESSCDDTSVALLDCSDSGHVVLAEKTASQIDIHQKYGGVVPEVAGRMHAEAIVPLIEEVLNEAKKSPLGRGGELRSEPGWVQTIPATTTHTHPTPRANSGHPAQAGIMPDAIAVTAGPGLVTGLLVGVQAAQALSYAWNVPLVATNHIEGHIHSVEIPNPSSAVILSAAKDPSPVQRDSSVVPTTSGLPLNDSAKIQFPALALVVSGGHTELVLLRDHGDYTILGRTKDDAAGECFDKVAKLLDLPYPGGPKISKLAETGRVDAIDFPRPMLRESNYDFSFAGLKTSALYWLRDNHLVISTEEQRRVEKSLDHDERDSSIPQNDSTISINDFCASFEQAITDVLVGKTIRAVEEFKPKCVVLGGGVAANKRIRETLREKMSHLSESGGWQSAPTLLVPALKYCMDNGAMIAVAGYYHAKKGEYTEWRNLEVNPNWRVDEKSIRKNI